jgi:hypothetical protein
MGPIIDSAPLLAYFDHIGWHTLDPDSSEYHSLSEIRAGKRPLTLYTLDRVLTAIERPDLLHSLYTDYLEPISATVPIKYRKSRRGVNNYVGSLPTEYVSLGRKKKSLRTI